MSLALRPHSRWPKPLRIVLARPRLFISIAFGIAVALVCPWDWRTASRMLTGWDVGVALYLVLAARMMWVADVHRIRRRARTQDEGQWTILALTAAAALASLGAIVVLLGSASASNRQPIDLMLAIVTILLSWVFTYDVRAPLRASVLRRERRQRGRLELPVRHTRARLLGFRVFLVRDRNHAYPVNTRKRKEPLNVDDR